ncbi:MAG: hypothetical protein II973_08370 [Spirochaetaceae bacterium]|nr:hypothetical protein [Spirochaetaceae bacterium]
MHKKGIMIFIFLYVSLVCCFSFQRKPPKKYYNKSEVSEKESSYKIILKSLKNTADYELVELYFSNTSTRLSSAYLDEAGILLKNEGKISFFEINKNLVEDNNTDIYDVIFYLYNKRKGRLECYNLIKRQE